MIGENGVDVDRCQIESFLRTCINVMMSEGTRDSLKDSSSGRPGKKLVDMQKRIWDDLGVSPDAGRMAVSRVEKTFPNDHVDLVSLREEFAKTADAAYLQCLEDRRPSVLKKKGKLPRNVLLEFFDACNLKLDTSEVREKLRDHIKDTGAMPDTVVNEVHDDVMELVGFEREHGQNCFKELGTSGEFANDRDIAVGFARWRGKTSSVCLKLLNEYRKDGGELNIDDHVKDKLLELQALEELDTMSLDERAELLKNNAKKVNVIRALPFEARKRYLEKLSEEEKLDLAKSQMLMARLAQAVAKTEE